ncbi:uncharacterized protein RHO25_013164 [Cercospora beticola]|nr:hypothetical protein RHO25_013164 [Cercospora beticola]
MTPAPAAPGSTQAKRNTMGRCELEDNHDLIENKAIWIIAEFEAYHSGEETCAITWKPVWVTPKEYKDFRKYVDDSREDRYDIMLEKHHVQWKRSIEPVAWIRSSSMANRLGFERFLNGLSEQRIRLVNDAEKQERVEMVMGATASNSAALS